MFVALESPILMGGFDGILPASIHRVDAKALADTEH